MTEPECAIPKIYTLRESADLLGVNAEWLRVQLVSRRFAAMKRGRRWAMTEPQILAAIDSMSTTVRPPDPNPLGLTPRSRALRRMQ